MKTKINSNNKNIFLAYLLLIIIYFCQGMLYQSGGILSQSTLLTIFFIDILYFFKVFKILRKNSFLKWWTVFYSIFMLSALITGDYTDSLHVSQIKVVSFVFLSIYPLYYWMQRIEYVDLLKKYFFLIALFAFYYLFYELTNLKTEYDKENVVSNSGYYFALLMPFLFLFKKTTIPYLMIPIAIILSIYAAKRGALFLTVISSIIYIYYSLKLIKKKSTLSKLGYSVVFILFISVSYYYFINTIEDSYILSRIEDNRSTRPENYLALWNNWYSNNSNIGQLLFGFGFYSTVKITPEQVMAHNDWLEVITDFGLIGLICYSLILFKFLRLRKFIADKSTKYIHLTVFISWIFISFFSMWMNNILTFFYVILIVHVLITTEKQKINTDTNKISI